MTQWLAGWLLVLAFGVGNLFKWSFFSPEVKVSLLDIVIFVLTGFGLVGQRRQLIADLKKYSRLIKPAALFAGVGLISLLLATANYAWQSVAVGGMYLLRWVTYVLFFLVLIRLFKAQQLVRLPLLLGGVTTLVGLGQYIFYPDIRQLQVLEWDPHYYRVVGSWLDPGFTGLLLVFTLLYLTLRPISHRFLNLLAWGGTYLALALTYSRSSYLAFLASMAWVAWKLKGGKFFGKILLLVAATILLLPRAPGGEGVKLEREYSIWSRIRNWGYSWAIFTDHPLLGVGFNTYRYAQKDYGFLSPDDWLVSHAGAGADASLLFVAATTGVVGLAAYLWYLQRLSTWGRAQSVLPATLVAALVHSWFLNSLFYPALMLWLALLVAESVTISRNDRRGPKGSAVRRNWSVAAAGQQAARTG